MVAGMSLAFVFVCIVLHIFRIAYMYLKNNMIYFAED